jgi:hypothetical protein
MSKNISNKLDELIEKIIENSIEDRKVADLYINQLVSELEDTNTPVNISAQGIHKFLEIKVKSNDNLIKVAANLQKREQQENDLMEEEEDIDEFVGDLYEKFSKQKEK